ncbi:MAG TPA: hypothetical protein PKO06_06080 [Candidatus Ozemobacteraceae bacterium]|nr:hypothetical protein [Candidatus Ozemobacteraceae bacterium]
MIRNEALKLLQLHLSQDSLIKHSLATEAIMRALATRFSENADRWGLLGLLHDLDFESTKDNMALHGKKTVELLGQTLDNVERQAILSHNEMTGFVRASRLDHALAAAESVTGLIAATALIYPDKKLTSVKVSSVIKRMKQPAFARAVSRETIMECEKIGLTLDEFITLSIEAMKSVADDLGL